MSDAAIKIVKSVHIGRYSGGLFAGPAPTATGATIPNSANSPHAVLVNAHGSGDDVPVRLPLNNVII
jgi:hypothetical protein